MYESAESSRKSALINWYLNEIADEIETEQELTEKKMMVERIVNRLIYQVSRFKTLIFKNMYLEVTKCSLKTNRIKSSFR